MKESYLSTREVADLLNVTETTIKRWTDSEKLKCIKTLGGHRKYRLEDIEAFASDNGISILGQIKPLSKDQLQKLGYAVYSNNTGMAADLIIEEALQGDREGTFELLMYLVKNRLKFADIADNIIKPAMDKVGDLWEQKELGIEQEHIVSDTIKTALARLVVYLQRQPDKGIKILCACTEGEQHDMGLQILAYELELNGFNIQFLGANTPFKSLIKLIKYDKPDFILLSSTDPLIKGNEFINGVRSAGKAAREYGAKLIGGGSYFQQFQKEKINCDAIVSSTKETISYIKKSYNKKERGT